MRAPNLRTDSRIRIRARDLDGSPKFATKVESPSDRGLWIYAPYTDDYQSMLRVGDAVEIVCSSRGAVYYFNSTIIGEMDDQVKLLEISAPQFVKREQRRDHVRVPLYIRANYAVESPDRQPSLEWRAAVTIDLSGGGVCLFIQGTDKRLAPGVLLRIVLPIRPGLASLQLRARIVRVQSPDLSTAQPGVCVAAEFIDLNEGQRGDIIRYVFDRQRALIRQSVEPE